MLHQENDGVIKINDVDISKLNLHDIRDKFSYQTQSCKLMNGYLRDSAGVTEFNRDQFGKYLSLFKLEDVLKDAENTVLDENLILSGGEQQSLRIIKTLISESEILLFDEPTNNLDPERKAVFLRILNEINKTILIITHDNEVISSCNHVIAIQ